MFVYDAYDCFNRPTYFDNGISYCFVTDVTGFLQRSIYYALLAILNGIMIQDNAWKK